MAQHDDINERIHREGLAWVAGETNVSGYRALNTQNGSGLLGLSIDERAMELARETARWGHRFVESESELPPAFDWRNAKGANWLSPVKEQQPCSSCVAFAVLASVEARVRIKRFDAAFSIDLSEGCQDAQAGDRRERSRDRRPDCL